MYFVSSFRDLFLTNLKNKNNKKRKEEIGMIHPEEFQVEGGEDFTIQSHE